MFIPMSHDTVSPHSPHSPDDTQRPDSSPQAASPEVEFCDPAPRTAPGSICAYPTLIVVLSRGAAVLSWRDASGIVRLPIHQQSVWFVPAGVVHATHWLEPARLVRVTFHPQHLQFAGPGGHTQPILVRLVDLARLNWNLAFLSRRLLGTIPELPAIPPEKFLALATEFSLLAIRCLIGPEATFLPNGLAVERFESVCDFIEENITIKFSRETLARADGQSLHHFARMFKQRIGLTPRQYIDRRRCCRAREMIEQGQKLADVAAAVGFFDQSEMCKKFNLVFGHPPSTYSPANVS